ncbi:MAG: DNA repair protein RecN [Endomicrobium sp.]|jgi:DNA repair protein RecN (Recombination protein N)|nr:DNA repair protein RecN [Endomicrobium sp.]
MLTALSIKNYALIEDLSINFSNGFTVITGETGAGKSILLKSIELLTGARADLSTIRLGCSVCTITASFEYKNPKIVEFLNTFSIPIEDNVLLIRRTIESSGKSKAFLNDSQVSIYVLAELGKLLVDFHGQNEKYSLLDLDYQLETLDNGISDIKSLLEKSSIYYEEIKVLQSKLEALSLSESDRERIIDLYSFQIKEIEEAGLEQGEEEKLEVELPKLKNAEKIVALSQEVISILHSSENAVLDGILKAKKNIEMMSSYGVDMSEAISLIEQAYYQIEEVYRGIGIILSRTELNPEKLNYIIERLDLIKKLKKRYGNTVKDIIEYKDKIFSELNSLINCKDDSEKIRKELELKTKCLIEVCEQITEKRKKESRLFVKLVQEKLFDLDIKNALFEVNFIKKDPSANGHDLVEFMFCANKGEKILPLKNTASGGELSRVLLAIELSSKIKSDQTTIFDEIDAGTGGKTCEKIGKKLAELSKRKQVISITHLAQVAAFAGSHVKIYKETENSRTYTKAKLLTESEHLEEIARMVSGENITKTALEHAKNLVASSLK